MGAGILPITICSDGKIYFLFGKENKYEDSASGWSDFGGGTDNKETFFQTACREGSEELTGFLGSSNDIAAMLKKNGGAYTKGCDAFTKGCDAFTKGCDAYTIDYTDKSGKYGTYRTHIFPLTYDPMLPYYYNNNQRFLQKHLSPEIIKSTKIFEKAEIRWICIDELKKMRKQFRSFYQHIVDEILANKSEITRFIKERNPQSNSKKHKQTNSSKSTKSKKHKQTNSKKHKQTKSKKNKSNKYI
jgi:8-oxo-dGTP pyrophosphatase MutT (NUDIX family)